MLDNRFCTDMNTISEHERQIQFLAIIRHLLAHIIQPLLQQMVIDDHRCTIQGNASVRRIVMTPFWHINAACCIHSASRNAAEVRFLPRLVPAVPW